MRRRKSRWGALMLLVFAVAVLGGFFYSFSVIVPNVRKLAVNRAKEIAVITIHEQIAKKLQEAEIDYDSIVRFTYADDGKIRAVSNNVSAVNILKSELVQEITQAISGIKTSEIALPLGTLSGVDFLYGAGPVLPISIKPYGYANADIDTRFYSSGINQTIFEVTANVSADVTVLMPMIKSDEKIKTSVPVISTVIVGDVPGSYTNVERYGEEFEEDVLQLAE